MLKLRSDWRIVGSGNSYQGSTRYTDQTSYLSHAAMTVPASQTLHRDQILFSLTTWYYYDNAYGIPTNKHSYAAFPIIQSSADKNIFQIVA